MILKFLHFLQYYNTYCMQTTRKLHLLCPCPAPAAPQKDLFLIMCIYCLIPTCPWTCSQTKFWCCPWKGARETLGVSDCSLHIAYWISWLCQQPIISTRWLKFLNFSTCIKNFQYLCHSHMVSVAVPAVWMQGVTGIANWSQTSVTAVCSSIG